MISTCCTRAPSSDVFCKATGRTLTRFWFWGLTYDYLDRQPTHGYTETREAARGSSANVSYVIQWASHVWQRCTAVERPLAVQGSCCALAAINQLAASDELALSGL